MPLERGTTRKVISRNVKREVAAGKPPWVEQIKRERGQGGFVRGDAIVALVVAALGALAFRWWRRRTATLPAPVVNVSGLAGLPVAPIPVLTLDGGHDGGETLPRKRA
jgi:hypothetical protein